MLIETQEYLADTKAISEWIVAVGGATGIIWFVLKKAAGLAKSLTPKRKVRGKRVPNDKEFRVSFITRLAIVLLIFSPYGMGSLYFFYDQFFDAALWISAQGIIIILISRSPMGKADMLLLWFLGLLVPTCLHMDVLFGDLHQIRQNLNRAELNLLESKMEKKVIEARLEASNADLRLIRSIEHTMNVELLVAPEKQKAGNK